MLAFNGKRAAQVFYGARTIGYGLQGDVLGQTRVFVVPSTSGAASGAWDVDKWRALARVVRQ